MTEKEQRRYRRWVFGIGMALLAVLIAMITYIAAWLISSAINPHYLP